MPANRSPHGGDLGLSPTSFAAESPSPVPKQVTEEWQSDSIPQYYINVSACQEDNVTVINGTGGVIHGRTPQHHYPANPLNCSIQVTAPQGMFITARVQYLHDDVVQLKKGYIMVRPTYHEQGLIERWMCCIACKFPLFFMPGNVMYIFYELYLPKVKACGFGVYFKATTEDQSKTFNVVHQSDSKGYITQHGFEQLLNIYKKHGLKSSYTLQLPLVHVLLLSFSMFSVGERHMFAMLCLNSHFDIYALTEDNEQIHLWEKCGVTDIEAEIFNSSLVLMLTRLPYSVYPSYFKAKFSFHPVAEAPQKLANGRFNCSRHYETFRHHVDCNVRVECENQEDETKELCGPCPEGVQLQVP